MFCTCVSVFVNLCLYAGVDIQVFMHICVSQTGIQVGIQVYSCFQVSIVCVNVKRTAIILIRFPLIEIVHEKVLSLELT